MAPIPTRTIGVIRIDQTGKEEPKGQAVWHRGNALSLADHDAVVKFDELGELCVSLANHRNVIIRFGIAIPATPKGMRPNVLLSPAGEETT